MDPGAMRGFLVFNRFWLQQYRFPRGTIKGASSSAPLIFTPTGRRSICRIAMFYTNIRTPPPLKTAL
ncbi:hypothetical protein XENTR_v10012536 [Xenopus tropicalis]|nr:hypothetical protein XENTR_v10012536 [Xenopus tropicalis]